MTSPLALLGGTPALTPPAPSAVTYRSGFCSSGRRAVSSQPPPDEIPAGLTTLHQWAPRHGRTYDYVRQVWRRRPGFPDPAGEMPARGRHGGGRGELLFDEAALDAWLASQPDLAPPQRIDPASLRIYPDERITLGRFA